ncbi:TPA: hypothetical protein ACPUGO_002637 [Klebsiella pneumoniae]
MDSEPVAWVSSESLDSRLAGIEAVTIPFVPGMDIPLFRRPVVTHNGDCDTDPFGFARRSGGLVVIDVNGDPHIKDGMPLYRHAQPAPEYPEILPCPVLLEPGLRFGKGIKTSTMLAALSRRAVYESDLAALSPEERVEFQAGIEGFKALIAQPVPVVPENCVTAEHRRVIEMLLNVCGAAFELADDSCQQDVDGEDCHVVPDDAFQKLSDALDEIENTLPTEDIDRPDVFLAWSAMPRAALKSIIQVGNFPVIPDGSMAMLRRWLAFGRGMQNAGSQLPRNLIAETEEMLAAAPQEVNHG